MTVSDFIYKAFIDPILCPLHTSASKYIKPNSKIIDIASGTGSFVFQMSERAVSVTGIDISESMLKIALKKQRKLNAKNVNFLIKDASNLSDYEDNTFDFATISMALHQFPSGLAIKIMFELKRIAQEIVIIDYAHPLPKNKFKVLTFIIERLAGREHFSCFKKYQSLGGLPSLMKKTGLRIIDSKIMSNGIFIIARCGI